jgi:hypothetical protein
VSVQRQEVGPSPRGGGRTGWVTAGRGGRDPHSSHSADPDSGGAREVCHYSSNVGGAYEEGQCAPGGGDARGAHCGSLGGGASVCAGR